MSFYKLGIKSDLVYILEKQDISEPTPIQKLSIPKILKGEDLIGEAQTGTGKTLAFLLPIFQGLDLDNPETQGLVIAPTRELAIQITSVARKLAEDMNVTILAAYGGQDVKAQLHKLGSKVQLIIGTPGRILDHIKRGSICFDELKYLVIDEADQLLHIGFKKDIEAIINNLPNERQTMCFSATMGNGVDSFSKKHLRHPNHVVAPKKQVTLDNIKQMIIETSNRKKLKDFIALLNKEKAKKAMIFCRTRVGTNVLYEGLKEAGFNVEELHGGLSQAKREAVMQLFREHKVRYLVATDVASRGLDVKGITHVFNYNLPDDPESYVHRIGRTGRAGHEGVAYTILTSKDDRRLEEIEKFIGKEIDRHVSNGSIVDRADFIVEMPADYKMKMDKRAEKKKEKKQRQKANSEKNTKKKNRAQSAYKKPYGKNTKSRKKKKR